MKDEKVKPPTPLMLAQLGFVISQQTLKTLGESEKELSFEAVQMMISSHEESKTLRELVEKNVMSVFGIILDIWKECLGIEVPFDKLGIPEAGADMKVLDYSPSVKTISTQKIFDAYAKKFGKDKVYNHYSKKGIDDSIKTQQARPERDYLFRHRGGKEPDVEHRNKDYNTFSIDGNKYMIPREGIISAFRYRFETGVMYDVVGATFFHALDSNGEMMYMYRYHNGRFHIDWGNRTCHDGRFGPRQIGF